MSAEPAFEMNGKPWSEEVVSVHELHIDPTYQRDPYLILANEIGRAFDLVLAGYIVVNVREDGTKWVVDGQQRTIGARKHGETELLARVFYGLTVDEEAQMFTVLNQTKPLTAVDKFKGAYAAGRPDALAIYTIVHSFGARIAGVDGRGDAISAVETMKTIYGRGGEHGLAETLNVIKLAMDELTKHTAQANFLTAVFMFVSRNRCDNGRLARQIKKRGFTAIKQQAMALGTRTADATAYYKAIVETYNYGLPAPKRTNVILQAADVKPPDEDEDE